MQYRKPLTDLPRALIEAGYEAPNYRTCYTAATDARIAAQKAKNGRWTFCPDDLPDIAGAMRLTNSYAA